MDNITNNVLFSNNQNCMDIVFFQYTTIIHFRRVMARVICLNRGRWVCRQEKASSTFSSVRSYLKLMPLSRFEYSHGLINVILLFSIGFKKCITLVAIDNGKRLEIFQDDLTSVLLAIVLRFNVNISNIYNTLLKILWKIIII
jgi:hypothetical protein